ncbi:ferredoxin [Thermococci archaeon]|nr:MAG: ferredoxin [Thermococci archaeon]
MPMPKVTIDHESCIACGVCASVAPEIFEANEEGKSILVEKFRTSSPTEGEIPDDMKDMAETAASSCPVGAIKVE